MKTLQSAAQASIGTLTSRCRLCGCQLARSNGDLMDKGLCVDCKGRPEARRLGVVSVSTAGTGTSARDFTAAEKALIRKMQGYLPLQQLLDLLNERLHCDLGPDAAPYTIDQLHAEATETQSTTGAGDWAGLRRVLASARRSGLLHTLTPQMLTDFSVVYSLSPAQAMRLKDVLLDVAAGDRS